MSKYVLIKVDDVTSENRVDFGFTADELRMIAESCLKTARESNSNDEGSLNMKMFVQVHPFLLDDL